MKNSQLGELPVLPQALHPQNAPGPALPFLTWSILQVGYVFLIPRGLFLIPAGLFLFPDLFRAGSCCCHWMRWGKVIKPQIFWYQRGQRGFIPHQLLYSPQKRGISAVNGSEFHKKIVVGGREAVYGSAGSGTLIGDQEL